MINWLTPEGIIIDEYENSSINALIQYEPIESVISIISSTLPNEILLTFLENGKYEITGTLPSTPIDVEYVIVMRAETPTDSSDRYFIIKNKNRKINWVDSQTEFNQYELTYFSKQLEITNPNGDELFVKQNGTLPPGITLSENGILYGVFSELQTTSLGKPEKITYQFNMEVYRFDQVVLSRVFTFNILNISGLEEPVWVTSEGNIGNINNFDESSLFVKAYDPQQLGLTYSMDINNNLPIGLTLNHLNGKIEGTLKTELVETWDFDIKVTNTNGYSSTRSFSIDTNTIDADKHIEWISEPYLGEFSIGSNVFFNLEVDSTYKCNFNILQGNLPSGIKFNNGLFTGSVDYQDLQVYTFLVEVTNGFSTLHREFSMTVTKGFGQNAVKCYFYMNNIYIDDYGTLKSSFDRNYSYSTLNEKYIIPTKPRIDICTMNTFDRILLSYMLDYNNPITLRGGFTSKKDFNDLYSIYYKQPEEQISVGGIKDIADNKIYVYEKDEYWYNEKTNQLIEEPITIISEEYNSREYISLNNEKIFITQLTSGQYFNSETRELIPYNSTIYTRSEVVNGLEVITYYIKDNNIEINVLETNNLMLLNLETNKVLVETIDIIPDGIQQSENQIRYYYMADTGFSQDIATINILRDRLTTPLYVEKSELDKVYYSTSTQEVITDELNDEEFIIKWDDVRKTFYVEYNDTPILIDIFAQLNTELLDVQAETEDGLTKIQLYTEFEPTDIKYNQFIVSTLDGEVQKNIIFTTEWNPTNKFFINDHNEVVWINEISKPWLYIPSKNPDFGFPNTIVLPFVNDDDVYSILDNPYIIFFDKTKEVLVEWKDSYYPTIDIFYSIQKTNLIQYQELQKLEETGALWADKDFIFYELTFEPFYNKNIDIFTIPFYNHNHKWKPHFQIP